MLIISCMRAASSSLMEFMHSTFDLEQGKVWEVPKRDWEAGEGVEGYVYYPSSSSTLTPSVVLIDAVTNSKKIIRDHVLPIQEHRDALMSIPKSQRKIVVLKRDAEDSFKSQMNRGGDECHYKSRTDNREECRKTFKKFRENIEIMFPEEDGFLHIEYEDLINNQDREIKKILDYYELSYDKEKAYELPHIRGWDWGDSTPTFLSTAFDKAIRYVANLEHDSDPWASSTHRFEQLKNWCGRTDRNGRVLGVAHTNSVLMNLVRGKRVAIIGPAPYLIGKGLGKEIDEYDIVCRINDIIPSEELREDFGSRTDILFHNMGTAYMPGLKRKIDASPEEFKNLSMVVCGAVKAKHTDTDFLQWPRNHISDVVYNFKKLNTHDIPFYWIGIEDYAALYNEIKVEFNSGMSAIMKLTEYPVQELFISGFTFYLGGHTEEELYYKGHWDDEDKAGKTDFGTATGHGLYANTMQVMHFIKLASCNTYRIKIDSHLNTLLNLDHPHVREL